MIHNPIIVGESTKGLMKFTARVSYTGSALNKKNLTIAPNEGELLKIVDHNGVIQLVNPVFSVSGAYPYVVVHASTSAYKITYGNSVFNGSITLSSAIRALYIGTLETL